MQLLSALLGQPAAAWRHAQPSHGTVTSHNANGGRLNPYKLGIELLRDIERRWNMGQFGSEWENCDDLEKKRNWNTNAGLGRR